MDTAHSRPIQLNTDGVQLGGRLTIPPEPVGVVLFATDVVNAPQSTLEAQLVEKLTNLGVASVLTGLLDDSESADREARSDVDLLTDRLARQVDWLDEQPRLKDLKKLLCGIGTGAAAAASLATQLRGTFAALMLLNGRVDLANDSFRELQLPLFFCIESSHPHLRDINMEVYEMAGSDTLDKHFLHGMNRDAVPIVARWLHSQASTTAPSACASTVE